MIRWLAMLLLLVNVLVFFWQSQQFQRQVGQVLVEKQREASINSIQTLQEWRDSAAK